MKIKLVIMALLTLFASMACAFDDDLNPFKFCFNFSGQQRCVDQKPELFLNMSSYAFGNQSTGTTRSTNISLTNTGNAALTDIVFQPFSSTVFTHSSSATAPCGTTLAAKATCYRKVSFTPAAATTYSDALTISSNQLDDAVVPVSGTGISGSISYLLTANFNGADSAPTGWTTSNITPTWNYATSPAPLEGSGSLYMRANAGASARIGTVAISAVMELYAATMWTPSNTQAVNNTIFAINTTDVFGQRCYINALSNNQFSIASPGGTTITSGAMRTYTPGVTYFLMLHYIAGTGANAQCIGYIATTAPVDASGWGTALSVTNGTSTSTVDRIGFYNIAGSGSTQIFDAVKVGLVTPIYP